MKNMFKKQLLSFSYAFRGLWSVLKTESHMRFHLVAALYVISFSLKFYNLSNAQWALLILTIACVFITEILNTVLERVCDTITLEYSKNIEFIKDVSASAVLVSAIAAIIVAFITLFKVDVFMYMFYYFTHNIFALILLVLLSALAVAFVIIKPDNYSSYIKKFFRKAKEEINENTKKD